jgi:hypothetical protein
MKFYFYKTTNNINGKFYYGSGQFDNYVGSGIRLDRAIKKYGEENFTTEILKYFETREEAYAFEDHFLKLYKLSKNPMSYNMKDAALGGDTLSNHPNREEIVKKLSESGKNRIFTDEHRKNLSESAKKRKGNKPSKFKGMKYEDYLSEDKCIETKNKLSNHFKGKSYEELYGEEKSKEIKLNISKSQKGKSKPMTESHKNNLIESFKNRDKKRKDDKIKNLIEYLDSIDLSNNPVYYPISKALNDLIKYGITTEGYIELKEYIEKEKFRIRSESNKNRTHTEETKKKLSFIAKNRSEETRKKLSESGKGKKHTEETKKKISESNKGKTLSQDAKEKIKKSLGTKIEIDGVIYYGYLDAERQLGIDRHKIKNLCLDPNEANFKLI